MLGEGKFFITSADVVPMELTTDGVNWAAEMIRAADTEISAAMKGAQLAVTASSNPAYENEYRYREERDRGRDTRGDDKNLEHCARALHQLVRVGEEQCFMLSRVLNTNADVMKKQTELLAKMSTDARVAELRAVKWEEHAVRLQLELDELRS